MMARVFILSNGIISFTPWRKESLVYTNWKIEMEPSLQNGFGVTMWENSSLEDGHWYKIRDYPSQQKIGQQLLGTAKGPLKAIMKHFYLIHDRLSYTGWWGKYSLLAGHMNWKWLLQENFPWFFFSLSKDGAIKDFWNTEFGFWNLRLRWNQRQKLTNLGLLLTLPVHCFLISQFLIRNLEPRDK